MLQTICDKCSVVIEGEATIYQMPRDVTAYARSRGGAKILGFDKIETRNTNLCENCARLIALQLVNIKGEQV